MLRSIFLLLLVICGYAENCNVFPLPCEANGRAQVVRVIIGSKQRNPSVVSSIAGAVSKYTLTSIDTSTFGFLASADGDNSCSITATAKTLTSPNNPWTSSIVGQTIHVQGAGIAGATLVTTVATFNSAGSITLTDAASTSVTASKTSKAGIAVWGFPATQAIETTPLLSNDGLLAYVRSSFSGGDLSTSNIVANGVTRTLGDKFNDFVSVRDFGAVGDGVTDDAAALNLAFAKVGKMVILPNGNFLVKSNLNEPTCAGIVGQGYTTSKITADTGVTNVIKIGTAATNAGFIGLQNLSIYGNNTNNAIGVIFGNNELINLQAMRGVQIRNFTGLNSIGLDVRDAVTHSFTDCYFNGNTQNVRINTGVVAGTPTTITFNRCGIRAAVGIGCFIQQGYQIRFNQCVFESNTQWGCYIGGVSGYTVSGVTFSDCWWEGNYGSNTAQFQCKVDGSAAATTIQGVRFEGGYFNGTGATAKSLHITGQFARSCYVANVIFPVVANGFKMDAAASTTIQAWPNNQNTNVIDDTATGTVYADGYSTAWTAWTPSYSCFGGMTIGTVTTTVARYKKVGKTATITLSFNGTTAGAASSGLIVSLPSGLLPLTADCYTPTVVRSVGTDEVGYVRTASGVDGLYFHRANFSNFGIGANTGAQANITFECQ